jgi:hypothetical protein
MFQYLVADNDRGHAGDQIRFLVVAVALTVALSAGSVSCSAPMDAPVLLVDESVGSDLRILAEETWTSFLAAFEARSDCFGPVTLRATRTLDSRAIYDPDNATVTVRVPGTPAMLRGALVHELAHHVEFQCKEHKDLRPAFLAALGLPGDTPWRPGIAPALMPARMWSDIPSEQYAEATIVFVLGRRQVSTGVRVTEEAVRAVGAWAAGD